MSQTSIAADVANTRLWSSPVQSAYQPIVDLYDGEVVAYEALARWPTLDITPDEAFAEARRVGRVAELDIACQVAALQGALDVGFGKEATLFVNIEPDTLGVVTPLALLSVFDVARERLRVVVELTERELLRRPADLLRLAASVRERGWGIAIDDIGAVPDSLALLPFVAPDVIKLDLSLVQTWPDREQAGIMTAVMAHAERTGATVLAEGIETAAHVEQALALGAVLGQGWFFGRAGPLGPVLEVRQPVRLLEGPGKIASTPFALVDPAAVRVGRKGLLLGFSRHLENKGLALETAPVILCAFQSADRFTPATARRARALVLRCPLVGALGTGMASEPVAGLRGGSLASDDPLKGEWTVVVVGAHYAGALIARDLGDVGPDLDRRYAFVVTHDRSLVLGAARSLLGRLESKPGPLPESPG